VDFFGNKYLQTAIDAAVAAGRAILEVYESNDFAIESKTDHSPLTKADSISHKVIASILDGYALPILSEEGKAIGYDTRKSWDLFWMVDPLDGTKEFIKRNGEFTVNIALIQQGYPIMGVVYVPVTNTLYYGLKNFGAFKKEGNSEARPIFVTSNTGKITIVASRSHMSAETENFIAGYKGAQLISMGSSLKLLLVAEGIAQLYPRFAPTMEWDTAAAHAVVLAAGGEVLQMPEKVPLTYNKESLLNPWFLVKPPQISLK
jgi:3'(2'), 5'-bisphosphate nucleotidase